MISVTVPRRRFEKSHGYEASIGVSAIAPATMTLPVPELEHILSVAAAYRKKTEAEKAAAYNEADLVGVNMEGPFYQQGKKRCAG